MYVPNESRCGADLGDVTVTPVRVLVPVWEGQRVKGRFVNTTAWQWDFGLGWPQASLLLLAQRCAI